MIHQEEDYIYRNKCTDICIQEYHTTGVWKKIFLDNAVRAGRLSDIRFAIEHGCPLEDPSIFLNLSLYSGWMDCVLYFHKDLKIPLNERSTISGACNPDIQFLKYAIENGATIHKEAIEVAAYNGLIENIKYLLQCGSIITQYAFNNIFLYDNPKLDIAELLIKNGYHLTKKDFQAMESSTRYYIPFDNPFWRQLLFDTDVSQYRNLEIKKKDLLLIQRLEDEIKQLKEERIN